MPQASGEPLSDLQQLAAYDQYLRRLDARAVLDHYGAQRCTEQVNRHDGSTEIVHSCLLDRVSPHHSNGDFSPSASCNVDNKKYVCYSMGWGGDLLRFIQVMEGKEELREAMPFAANFLSEAVIPAEQLCREVERIFDQGGYTGELVSIDASVLNGWAEGHPYWNERGITYAALEELRLGYDPKSRRLVFPHFFEGKLTGWQKRAIPGESVSPEPKYQSSPGMPKSTTLYNFDNARAYDRVCVVESPMSVAKAYSLGIPNVVATFGAKVSKAQAALLIDNFEMVYLWFDRDGAGMGAELRMMPYLWRRIPTFVVAPDRGKDMADCDEADIAVKLAHAAPAALKLGQYDLARKLQR